MFKTCKWKGVSGNSSEYSFYKTQTIVLENNYYIKYIRVLALIGIFLFFMIYSVISMLKPPGDEYKLKRDVSFEGIVTDFYNDSCELHCFGIVRVKITKSNTKIFNTFQKEGIYPYNIQGDNGEIYNTYPSNLKIGDKVYVDSKRNEILYYQNNKLFTVGNLYIIKEESFIEFIKKVKRLNN